MKIFKKNRKINKMLFHEWSLKPKDENQNMSLSRSIHFHSIRYDNNCLYIWIGDSNCKMGNLSCSLKTNYSNDPLSTEILQVNWEFHEDKGCYFFIQIPIMNEEINLSEDKQCLVYGIQKVVELSIHPLRKEGIDYLRSINKRLNIQQQKDVAISQVSLTQPYILPAFYVYSKYSEEILSFSSALEISKELLMDLTLMKE